MTAVDDLATPRARGAARAAAVFAGVLFVAVVVVGAVGPAGVYWALGGPWMLSVLAFPVTGTLLVLARPRHRYAWFVMTAALVGLASMLLTTFGELARPDELGLWLLALGDATNTAAIVVTIVLAMLLFPEGSLPGPWWRAVVAVAVVAAALGFLAALIVGGWGGDTSQADYVPPLSEGLSSVGSTLSSIFFPLMIASQFGGAVSLISRYRRSTGIERKQLQWLAVAGAYAIVIFAFTIVTTGSAAPSGVNAWAMSAAYALVPVGIAIAVLRYRLYDVDVVINRSLMAAGLALFILVVYVGVVVGVGTLVTDGDEPNLGLQIGATALVAVGFQPWRRRMRQWADRVVYGRRTSPYEVLASFARIAAQAADASTQEEIADLLARGTGADPAVLWLRVGDNLRPVACRPRPVDLVPAAVTRDDHPAVPGDLVVPVEHDGELLGALSVTKPRGEPVSTQDVDVAERLAAGVALTLRSGRLTAELGERLEQLRDSRARIVRAQDDARRRLERDLHDGAQQQLVALKVKLGLARSQAERLGAPRTATMLGEIATDADDAVTSLRELARGIYPPLLETEGLTTALSAQARKAAVPVDVVGDAVGRLPRDLEIAVYFCVLEALQNVAKYAQASHVRVELAATDEALSFTVRDDGVGFDRGQVVGGTGLQGMRDRLDTVGGVLTVASARGHGTTVTGVVPTTVETPATGRTEPDLVGDCQ